MFPRDYALARFSVLFEPVVLLPLLRPPLMLFKPKGLREGLTKPFELFAVVFLRRFGFSWMTSSPSESSLKFISSSNSGNSDLGDLLATDFFAFGSSATLDTVSRIVRQSLLAWNIDFDGRLVVLCLGMLLGLAQLIPFVSIPL